MNNLKTDSEKLSDGIDDYLKELRIKGDMPHGIYGDFASETLKKYVKSQIEDLWTRMALVDVGQLTFNESKSLIINQHLDSEKRNVTWTLSGELCAYVLNGKSLHVFDFNSSYMVKEPKFKNKYWLSPYLSALTLIAEQPVEQEYDVTLFVYYDDSMNEKTFRSGISPSNAKDVLKLIYEKMYVEKLCRFHSIDITDDDYSELNTFRKFKKKAVSTEDWKYFSKKVFFNPEKDFGYDASSDSAFWGELQNVHDLFQNMILIDF